MHASRARRDGSADGRPDLRDTALVICGHGSHLNPDSSSPVYDHAARIHEQGTFAEVREAFWKEEPSLRNALRTVDAEDVVVVPLFVSEGYFTDGVIPRELRLHGRADGSATGDDADDNGDATDSSDAASTVTTGADGSDVDVTAGNALDVAKRVWYTDPVGTNPSMTDVIVARAERITDDPDVGPETGLAVIGHGTERNPKSARAIRAHAARIGERGRFAAVEALFMDQEPFVDEVLEHFDTHSVVAVPLFIADGFHTREEIPELLGLAGEYPAYENPSDVDGTTIWYAGAVGTEPSFSEVIAERAREALSSPPDADARPTDRDATDEHTTETATARAAFVERVDRAVETSGASTWGQLLITDAEAGVGSGTSAGDGSTPDGSRTYELRHEADRNTDPAALDTYTDSDAAQELARFDDEGEYRPLKSAPTLVRGWRLTGLDSRGLTRAISSFYPASVPNWYREREGYLDVTHYAETAARQTGMYDPVDELSGRALDRAVRACCTDDVCLKRRVWEAGEDGDAGDAGDAVGNTDGSGREIDAPPGDGAFPCREPCSLFVAAAREFVLAERDGDGNAHDDGDTASTTLTETDREDLDAILTELVENPEGVTPVRDGEASEPTNRYRVRYLREKLRDMDGRHRGADDEATTEHEVTTGGGD